MIHDLSFIVKIEFLDNLSYINRLAESYKGCASIAEIIAIFDTCRHDIHRHLLTEGCISSKSSAESTFSKCLKRVSRSVATFREHAETHLVLERVHDDFLCLIVLEYISESVPLANHRKDSDKVHQFCNECVIEHIRSGSEYCLVIESTKNYERIHQSVTMVWCDYDCTICRNVFLSSDFNLSVAMLQVPIDNRLQDIVAEVFVVYVLSHFDLFLSPLQRPFFR